MRSRCPVRSDPIAGTNPSAALSSIATASGGVGLATSTASGAVDLRKERGPSVVSTMGHFDDLASARTAP